MVVWRAGSCGSSPTVRVVAFNCPAQNRPGAAPVRGPVKMKVPRLLLIERLIEAGAGLLVAPFHHVPRFHPGELRASTECRSRRTAWACIGRRRARHSPCTLKSGKPEQILVVRGAGKPSLLRPRRCPPKWCSATFMVRLNPVRDFHQQRGREQVREVDAHQRPVVCPDSPKMPSGLPANGDRGVVERGI